MEAGGQDDEPIANLLEFPQLFTHEPTIQEIETINWFEPNPDDPNIGFVIEENEKWCDD